MSTIRVYANKAIPESSPYFGLLSAYIKSGEGVKCLYRPRDAVEKLIAKLQPLGYTAEWIGFDTEAN